MPLEPLPLWRIVAPAVAFLILLLVRSIAPQPRLEIIWRSCLATICYAMLQDQISARLSSAYFTIGHPPIAGLNDPTMLGLAWGFLGGFPAGILLGLAFSLSATLGSAMPAPLSVIQRLLYLIVFGMGFASISAGGSAAYNATLLDITLGEPWASLVPVAQQRNFFIVACTHFGTYLGGAISGALGCGWLIWYRHPTVKIGKRK